MREGWKISNRTHVLGGRNNVGASPEWNVSHTTGTDIDGAILHVFKIDDLPNDMGGRGNVIRHPKYDGLVFPNVDAGTSFCLSVGILRPWISLEDEDGRYVFDLGRVGV